MPSAEGAPSSINSTETNGAKLEDLTADNLTQHVIKISSNISNERIKFIFSKLIQHAHDFAREVDLQRDEWEASWQFLTEVSVYLYFFLRMIGKYIIIIYFVILSG